MKQKIIHNVDLEELRSLADDLACSLNGGETICLYGNLGSGKTTLSQMLAKSLGATEHVTSPTFVLMKKYILHPPKTYSLKPKTSLYHLDAYRLGSDEEALDLGIEEIWSDQKNIMIIEWADKLKNILPEKRIDIYLEPDSDSTRNVTIIRR